MKPCLPCIAVLATVLSGCFAGDSSTPIISPETQASVVQAGIFPHKSNWKEPTQHGVYVKDILQYDTNACISCHDEDGVAGKTKGGAPGCRSCHTPFPHTEAGVTKEIHGDYVLKNGKTACATTCHGPDWKGGLSGVACTKCHNSYPHAIGWSSPAVHGPAAKGDLKLKCALCHGSDLSGGATQVSCLNCHKGNYPHPTGWSAPDQHGAFVSKNGAGKCTTQCHGVQLEGGLSGTNCTTCHAVWPHPKTIWLDQHGEKARTIGLSGCTGCHKSDATGGNTGVTCTQCHAALTSHQDADWLNGGHGARVIQQPSVLTDNKGCPLCHGAKLDGGKVPASPMLKAVKGCKDCHASYPAPHKLPAGAPAWGTYGGHATWLFNQVDIIKGAVLDQINTLIADCKLCHGADLKGGATGIGCKACHANFPHNTDSTTTPWLSKHGAVASAENPKASSCATVNCHGQKLDGSSFNGKKFVAVCLDCHLQMPHQATWPKTHGASAATNISACRACHGADLKGKGIAPSCDQCHSNFPLHHRNKDGTKNNQWKPATGTDFHGKLVMAASGVTAKNKAANLKCTTCHDSGNAGNPSPSCYSCHANFPHAEGWANATNGGTHKLVVLQNGTAGCLTGCHGGDGSGGTSKVACTKCHNYPHAAGWVKAYDPNDAKTPGGAHGLAAVKSGNNICLMACHGSDGSGGDSKKACTTCHSYPHPAGWKTGVNSPEYPPHAAAVMTANNTPAKDDDSLNVAIFAECAKCHGAAIVFADDHYPLTGDEQKMTLEPNVTVPRCTQCHTFPHITALGSTWADNYVVKPYPWNKVHWSTLGGWQLAAKINTNDPNAGAAFSQQTCGSAADVAGCHTTGPWPTGKLKVDFDSTGFVGCNYCHLKQP